MDLLKYYLDTSIRGNVRQRCSFQFKIDSYYCSHEEYIECENEDESELMASPLLSMAYDGRTCLASANEAGHVKLNNVNNFKTIGSYQLHQNAIFNIKWRPQHPGQLMTAAGDLSISLVDLESPDDPIEHLTDCHDGSVRVIDFQDTNVFASGARDGHIKIWDLRESAKPKVDIPNAHEVNVKNKRRRNRRQKTCPTNVVTSILFNDYQLYSGGASDGVIKVWDTRSKAIHKGQPIHQITYDGFSSFSDKQGYTCFTMSKGLLYASCSDKIVYCYSPQLDKMIGRYKGARINNYTRISILQDEYLISGSMNKCACVWKLSDKPLEKESVILPSYVLPEEYEVASLEVVSKAGYIFTGSDAGRLRRWTFEPLLNPEEGKTYEKIFAYSDMESLETTFNESEIENTSNNSILEEISVSENIDNSQIVDSPKVNNRPTPRMVKSRKPRKRKSPRSNSPKPKKSAKTRHQPTEPLTPITNYYQKLPKKND